ncbi:Formylglycine-generating enzyme, required for sulfatase activity, contains SUMF1/FGE domain [Methylobacterium pseudosasicola]|uniref:Formylglycine-generating enzyme, required for sulfatase activity, contains SUMF1/FGE domain n=2 Tax=Methylobacterium pseudosasicola TaxID=582667 RepID=A0A1I4RBA9_9HYPH|nr:Formylglycine-generating enzyme, required for sulfatase activity, contains SUMF1/FGE domain [Methylobacterium pseudosasicola]
MPGRIDVWGLPEPRLRKGLPGRIRGYGVLIGLTLITLSGLLLAVRPGQAQNPIGAGRRFALLIANSRYPDAQGSLPTVAKDGRLLAEELRRSEFDVDLRENLRREDVQATLDAFYAKLNAGAAALVYFGGYGIQVERQSYLIPVNAQIWSETEVRRDGINLDAILSELNRRGVRVKIAVVDAARQNPFERRFRASSAGLAPVDAPEGSLVLFSAPPGKVVREDDGDISLFVSELGKELRAPNITAEEAFTHTRIGVSRASKAERVPWISSSLIEEFRFSVTPPDALPAPATDRAGRAEPSRLARRSPPDSVGPSPPALPPPAIPPAPSPAAAVPSAAALPAQAQTSPPQPQTRENSQAAGQSLRDCDRCPELVILRAGTFEMGAGALPFDRPVHRVTIPRPFAIARRETTVDEWHSCVEAGACKYRPNPSEEQSGAHPITNVSWFDAQDYVAWLSARTRRTYRLPSEAEWEYAARGGTNTAFAWGAQVGDSKANCRECSRTARPELSSVASFAPNGFGLFDMAGNAAEWVEDCWNESYRGAPQDGTAWSTGSCGQRVLRGGSFDSTATYVKPTARFRYDADVRYYANGFRVARGLP